MGTNYRPLPTKCWESFLTQMGYSYNRTASSHDQWVKKNSRTIAVWGNEKQIPAMHLKTSCRTIGCSLEYLYNWADKNCQQKSKVSTSVRKSVLSWKYEFCIDQNLIRFENTVVLRSKKPVYFPSIAFKPPTMTLLISMPGATEVVLMLVVLVIFPIALIFLLRWILRINYRDQQLSRQTQLLAKIAKHSGVPESEINTVLYK